MSSKLCSTLLSRFFLSRQVFIFSWIDCIEWNISCVSQAQNGWIEKNKRISINQFSTDDNLLSNFLIMRQIMLLIEFRRNIKPITIPWNFHWYAEFIVKRLLALWNPKTVRNICLSVMKWTNLFVDKIKLQRSFIAYVRGVIHLVTSHNIQQTVKKRLLIINYNAGAALIVRYTLCTATACNPFEIAFFIECGLHNSIQFAFQKKNKNIKQTKPWRS